VEDLVLLFLANFLTISVLIPTYSEINFDLYLNKDFSKPIAAKIPRENIKIRLDYLFPWTYYWNEFPILKFIGSSDSP